jgi:multidrug transporter EmrE-like cation transporter
MRHELLTLSVVTLLISAAQVLLKRGVADVSATGSAIGILESVLTSPFLLAGCLVYGGSFVLYLWVLTRVPLSLAYPFLGASYVIVAASGIVLFDEQLDTLTVCSSTLIFVGVGLLGIKL